MSESLYRRRQELANHLGQHFGMRVAWHVTTAFEDDSAGVGQTLHQHLLVGTRYYAILIAADEQHRLTDAGQDGPKIEVAQHVRLRRERRQTRAARTIEEMLPHLR